MPSSTSNSEDRVPRLPWGRIWPVAIILLLVLCGGAEVGWRRMGHRPSIVDDPDWWAYHRGRVYGAGHKSVVLIGASRCQLDFSTDTFRKVLPGHSVVQLSVDARGSYEVLQDLAQDEAFTGIVICSTGYDGALPYGGMREYLDAFHRRPSVDASLNRRIATWLQGRLVLISPSVQTAKTVHGLLEGAGLPSPYYLSTHFDRSRSVDYALIHRAMLAFAKRNGADVLSEEFWCETREDWPERVAEVEQFVEQIQRRGGEVVLVCLPSTGGYLSVYESETPKADYWDRLAEITKAVPIHFQDVRALSVFDCPDGSHLDFRDTRRFTEAFVGELARQGALPRK